MEPTRILLPNGTLDKLESIRKEEGLRDYGETLAFLVNEHKEHRHE